MEIQNLDSATEQELVASYQESKTKRSHARRCITLLILGVIAIFASLMWTTFRDFKNNRMPEFGAALGVEAGRLAPTVGNDLKAMAERLYPQYVAAFRKTFERDLPKMKEQGKREMLMLDTYAQSRWPKIQSGLADVVTVSEITAREELSKFVDAKDVENISVAYGEALKGELDSVLSTSLKEHVDVAQRIGRNLLKMTATEPDIKPPIDMRNTLGMMLELTGSELQKGM